MKTFVNRFAGCLLVALVCLLLPMEAAWAGSGSEGKEFYLAFQKNFGGADQAGIALFISGPRDTRGYVEVAGLALHIDFEVQANQSTTVVLPRAVAMLPAEVKSTLTVHVVAEDDVSVYGLNRRSGTTAGFLALPVDALGLEYYALTYTAYDKGQLTLIAPHDNTQITITPEAYFGGRNKGTPFTLSLNKGETYLLEASPLDRDLSGTRIVASAPIVVMAGAEAAHIPNSASYLDHIVEMMPPLSTWGKSFLTVPLAVRTKGDMFRVLASENNTQVRINGTLVATLQKGKFYESIRTTRMHITTSAPALVMQFSLGSSYDGTECDPFEMIVPPAEQFRDRYTISTPDSGFPLQFVNVVVPSGAAGTLELNGTAVNTGLFSAIGSSGFSGAQIPVGAGSHTFRSNTGVPFGVSVYGFGYHDGYGYPGGMSFEAINPTGDPYVPALRLVPTGNTVQGSAADSEDLDANGVLDAGEDRNGNGTVERRTEDLNGNGKLDAGEDANGNSTLDRDTGVFKVELAPGAVNLRVNVLPFVPGTVAVQFTIDRPDPTVPGTGTVVVSDGAGNKASAPVEVGMPARMRDVRVVATLPAAGIDLDLASFRRAPHSVTSNADQHVIEWRFDLFTADSAADLGFDVIFKNPQAGQKKEVTHQVDIFYTDANGQALHTALGSAHVDVMSSTLAVSPATDKPIYAAGEGVRMSTVLQNLAGQSAPVTVRLFVRDLNNKTVADIGSIGAPVLAAGGTVRLADYYFPLTQVYAGTYRVIAEAVAVNGATLATGMAQFEVKAADTSLEVAVSSDKRAYNPGDTAVISDRLASTGANQIHENLRLTTTVTNTDGTVRMAKSETIVQLVPGTPREFRYNVPLASAPSGQYSVTLALTRIDGTALAQSSTAFTVTSSADSGAGLSGTVSALPQRVPLGTSVAFPYSVTNGGNATLPALPIKVSIVDLARATQIAEFPVIQTLEAGATHRADVNWLATGTVGDNLVAIVSASVGSKSLALAQAAFSIAPPPVQLDLGQVRASRARVLAMPSCGESGPVKPSECEQRAAAAAAQALTAIGIPHTVVTEAEAFRRELRSGRYTTYWLSGKQDKLDAGLVTEVVEAVHGGAALIVDGAHDERNKALDLAAGITYRGKMGQTGLLVNVDSADFSAGQLTVAGRALRLELGGGVAHAAFADAQQDAGGPAIIANVFGGGSSTTFAFDLLGSMADEARWQGAFARAIELGVAPPVADLAPGSLVEVRTTVANQAQAAGVTVRSVLPQGAIVIGSNPQASVDTAANTATWQFDLSADQATALSLTFAAPAAPGVHAIRTDVSTTFAGVTTPYGEPLVKLFTVKSAAQLAADVRLALEALTLDKAADRKQRDTALALLQQATTALGTNTRDGSAAALDALVGAVNAVASLPGDTAPIRLGLDALLKEAGWRWWSAAPAQQ